MARSSAPTVPLPLASPAQAVDAGGAEILLPDEKVVAVGVAVDVDVGRRAAQHVGQAALGELHAQGAGAAGRRRRSDRRSGRWPRRSSSARIERVLKAVRDGQVVVGVESRVERQAVHPLQGAAIVVLPPSGGGNPPQQKRIDAAGQQLAPSRCRRRRRR